MWPIPKPRDGLRVVIAAGEVKRDQATAATGASMPTTSMPSARPRIWQPAEIANRERRRAS